MDVVTALFVQHDIQAFRFLLFAYAQARYSSNELQNDKVTTAVKTTVATTPMNWTFNCPPMLSMPSAKP